MALDLDGTLVNLERSRLAPSNEDNCITIMNGHLPLCFRLVHGALEFVKALSVIPGAKITFFSAGQKWRNDILVDKLMKTIDRRWQRGFFRTHYHVISTNGGAKDLRELFRHPEDDLEQVVLIDDHEYVLHGQQVNVLKVPPPTEPLCEGISPKNKLVLILAIIMEAAADTARAPPGNRVRVPAGACPEAMARMHTAPQAVPAARLEAALHKDGTGPNDGVDLKGIMVSQPLAPAGQTSVTVGPRMAGPRMAGGKETLAEAVHRVAARAASDRAFAERLLQAGVTEIRKFSPIFDIV